MTLTNVAGTRCWPALAVALILVGALLLTGCAPRATPGAARTVRPTFTPDPVIRAASEATAILSKAQATALIIRARREATAQVKAAGGLPVSPTPVPFMPEGYHPIKSETSHPRTATPLMPLEPYPPVAGYYGEVMIIDVGIAGEGKYIHVQFHAHPGVADLWEQGMVYVVDEATGTRYDEIPVMPIVGPLFGKPARDGLPGYVMLVNRVPSVQPGALVTVVLGGFKLEHVKVSQKSS